MQEGAGQESATSSVTLQSHMHTAMQYCPQPIKEGKHCSSFEEWSKVGSCATVLPDKKLFQHAQHTSVSALIACWQVQVGSTRNATMSTHCLQPEGSLNPSSYMVTRRLHTSYYCRGAANRRVRSSVPQKYLGIHFEAAMLLEAAIY